MSQSAKRASRLLAKLNTKEVIKMKVIHVNDEGYQPREPVLLTAQQVKRILQNPRGAQDVRDEIAERLQSEQREMQN